MADSKKSIYSETWDNYVTETFPQIQATPTRSQEELHSWQVLNTVDKEFTWPGDEWGDAAAVQNILQTCVFDYFDETPGVFCELASGSGRFTDAVMKKFPSAEIDCFDISQEFLNQMMRRFQAEIERKQVQTHLLTGDPRLMYKRLAKASRVRSIDCVFSYDAMVHVDLHSVAIYIATAAAVLKPGGLLSMSVADASTELGLQKLLFNAPGVFRRGGAAGGHFQFASPEAFRAILSSLGFSYEFHDCNQRDLFFSARLEDPDAARRAFEDAGRPWLFTP